MLQHPDEDDDELEEKKKKVEEELKEVNEKLAGTERSVAELGEKSHRERK